MCPTSSGYSRSMVYNIVLTILCFEDPDSVASVPVTTLSSSTPKLPVGMVYEGDIPPAPPPSIKLNPSSAPPANQTTELSRKKREERKLAIMMMSKKRKWLFDRIMKSRRRKSREVSELKRKRSEYEDSRTEDTKRVKVT